ncbi:MAG: bifunctional metallophosphatase/5'-nucleotidase [Gemmatimonadota bacterium]
MRPRLLLAAPTLALLVACSATGSQRDRVAPVAGSGTFTILHINDVYEITAVGGTGGLARLATLRRQLEEERGRVLLTLGGDFLSPSALGTALVDGQPLAGAQMIGVLNAVGLDWATLGNHEFDVGEQALRNRIAESRFGWVISNVTDGSGSMFPGTVSHAIVRVLAGGRPLRLGLLGIVLPANRVSWVRYADQYESARRTARMLRDSADVVIAITHQYYYEDARLAGEVPDIDLILGGHEHDNLLLYRGPNQTPILKADGNALSAWVATIDFRPGRRPHVTPQLVHLGTDVPEDPGVVGEAGRWLSRAFAGYERAGFSPRRLVASLQTPLDAREVTIRAGPAPITNMMSRALLREEPGADVAVFNAGTIRVDDVIPAGPVTEYDVIRILPFGGPAVSAEISGRMLADIVAAGRRNRDTGGFLHFLGLEASADTIRVRGQPLDPDRRYRIVTVDFLLTGRERNLAMLTRSNPDVRNVRDLRDVRKPLIDELAAAFPPPP